MTDPTIVSLFNQRVDELASQPALHQKTDDGHWEVLTWSEYGADVRAISRALASDGVGPGDGVAILSTNRREYHLVDMAALSLGAIAVPIYQTNSPEQVRYVLEHSDAKIVFCENTEQCAKVAQIRAGLSQLKKVVTFLDGRSDEVYAELLERGRELDAADPSAYIESSASVKPDDIACLIYTSGTTGPPKGAMLTHQNVVWTGDSLAQLLNVDRPSFLSFLPLAHIAERMVSHYGQIRFGGETWFGGGAATLREDLAEVRPTILFAVPRIWEKVESALRHRFEQMPGLLGRLAQQNLAVNGRLVDTRQAGERPRLLDRLIGPLLDRVAGAKVRSQLGLDLVTDAISGAAPIARETLAFFHALGIPIREVYGQTEGTGPTSLMPRDDIRLGTVGKAIPGVEIKIAADDEILFRGGNVFSGYYKNDQATADTVIDGWVRSGDLGRLDADGFLSIIGRKKDLIITAGGKNISPQNIESALRAHEEIGQAVVIGDGRRFMSALITLDPEGIETFARERGGSADPVALVASDDARELVERIVDDVNARLSNAEAIKKFTILAHDFSQETGELTPTLKVMRHVVSEKYAAEIEAMYE
ncbi:MAG: long-chain fatty acid--CoA ligase [Deltaproteobacteria bacterium]|nr:long-chain fatty acid--CoA ligase [Deltaproteobacteria bacterium]